MFGSTFDLPMDLKNGVFGPDHSQHIMDSVFSHFIGISAAASVALTVYITVRGKKSFLQRQLIVPSFGLWCDLGDRASGMVPSKHRGGFRDSVSDHR